MRDRTIELADANARLTARSTSANTPSAASATSRSTTALTNLPNRRLLEERLHETIEEARAMRRSSRT